MWVELILQYITAFYRQHKFADDGSAMTLRLAWGLGIEEFIQGGKPHDASDEMALAIVNEVVPRFGPGKMLSFYVSDGSETFSGLVVEALANNGDHFLEMLQSRIPNWQMIDAQREHQAERETASPSAS